MNHAFFGMAEPSVPFFPTARARPFFLLRAPPSSSDPAVTMRAIELRFGFTLLELLLPPYPGMEEVWGQRPTNGGLWYDGGDGATRGGWRAVDGGGVGARTPKISVERVSGGGGMVGDSGVCGRFVHGSVNPCNPPV